MHLCCLHVASVSLFKQYINISLVSARGYVGRNVSYYPAVLLLWWSEDNSIEIMYLIYTKDVPKSFIRESVDFLCRNGADMPIVRVHR